MGRVMHDQTRFFDKEKGTRGNCLQACLASVLGLPLDAVPDLTAAHPADWMDDMKAFAAWGGYEWHFGAPEEVPPGTLYIVNGPSKRGARHSTIWKDGVMVHDPHPDKSGLEAQDGNVWWFVRAAQPRCQFLSCRIKGCTIANCSESVASAIEAPKLKEWPTLETAKRDFTFNELWALGCNMLGTSVVKPNLCYSLGGTVINLHGNGEWYCNGCGASHLEPACKYRTDSATKERP